MAESNDVPGNRYNFEEVMSERSVATQHFRIVTSGLQQTEPGYAVASAGVYIFGEQVDVGCADAQTHDVGNRDAQADWKSNVDRKRRAAHFS
jgi:hypothetical protein